MEKRGGRRSTTFKKGQGKAKGTKNVKTKIKEQMGLAGWAKLCDYILNDGAEKYVTEMKKLTGPKFHIAYNSLTEYIKPKLSRIDAELSGKGGTDLFSSKTDDELKSMLQDVLDKLK